MVYSASATERGTVPARSDETRALGDLAARGAARLTDLVRGTHEAIARRTFRAALASSSPAGRGHDAISAITYATVRGTSAAAIGLSGRAVAAATRERAPLADTPRGSVCLGALNGAIGDELEKRDDPLAIRMELRHEGRTVPASPPGLAGRFPHAAGRIAVFVHGLCETERAWWLGADPEHGGETYGARLEQELGYTPLYVRYNTGLHISVNGQRLSRLLADLVATWPVPVEEIVLVGHSMGGLVARSACRAALDGAEGWVGAVTHGFYLGSPHGGADLEKAANLASSLLAGLPETRGFARALNGRSAGIKDLRFGYLLDEDWQGRDPDELLRCYRGDVPFIDTAAHYFIAATLTADGSHPVGRLVGDLLVRLPSAWADGQHSEHHRFDLDRSRSIGPLTHFDLLNHPAVYREMRRWVERSPNRRPGAAREDQ
jgi:pimeloyl-ACP methyl ester carboxylesterase